MRKTSMVSQKEKYMRRALTLARRGIGRTSPNPCVGCIIVRRGEIVGEGWHRQAGSPHAEIHALQMAGSRSFGADMYVTLEPCNHFGKTPPCTDALIQRGIRRVFAGMIDPNPQVSGQGLERLRSAGVEVETGILESDCRLLNRAFIKQISSGIPFVLWKSAMTLDGKTATRNGHSQWITGEKARQMVHRLRNRSDMVMVGIETVLADDPQLTCRMPGGRHPHRLVLDSRLRIPLSARVLQEAAGSQTWIATLSDDRKKIGALADRKAVILRCRESQGHIDLRDLMTRLGQRGIQSVLLEGGARLAGNMLRERLIDYCMIFCAPKLLGGDGLGLLSGPGATDMNKTISLSQFRLRRIGTDVLMEGEPVY